jgi:hypothetical protein
MCFRALVTTADTTTCHFNVRLVQLGKPQNENLTGMSTPFTTLPKSTTVPSLPAIGHWTEMENLSLERMAVGTT